MGRVHRIWLTLSWFQFLAYPTRKVPLTEVGETQETGDPWRVGRCRVFRVPLTRRAVAIGKWTGYQERDRVEGFDTFLMREVTDWRSVVDVQPSHQEHRAG